MLNGKTIGLGLRKEFLYQLKSISSNIQYLEIAPENWINIGGKLAKELDWFRQRYPIAAHGLSLSLGSSEALNLDLLNNIKNFLKQYQIELYTEHISFTGIDGILYDLLPLPFTKECIENITRKINQTQDILGHAIAIENTSYYASCPFNEIEEIDFINEILAASGCYLHLDINNVFVNSVNFNFNPYDFLNRLPKNKIVYMHIAGHDLEDKNLIIDTHGQDICPEVWQLLKYAYKLFGIIPTTLERDLNIPPLDILLSEIDKIKHYQELSLHEIKSISI